MSQRTAELWWLLTAGSVTVLIVVVALMASLVLHQRRFVAMTRAFNGQLLMTHEAERARVAGELHDGLIQRVAILGSEVAQLEDAERVDAEHVAEWAKAFRAELQDLASDIRRLAHGMHPALLDNLGLVAALQILVEDVANASGLRAKLLVDDPTVSVEPVTALCLYRAAQEGLANVIRHAQGASATLQLQTTGAQFCLSVTDTGADSVATIGATGRALGLKSLDERARMLGGTVTFRTRRGLGSELQMTVPA